MNWWRCWFGWHRWEKAPTFAHHPRRECARCGISQGHDPYFGWTTEDASMRWAVNEGLRLKREIDSYASTGDSDAN